MKKKKKTNDFSLNNSTNLAKWSSDKGFLYSFYLVKWNMFLSNGCGANEEIESQMIVIVI